MRARPIAKIALCFQVDFHSGGQVDFHGLRGLRRGLVSNTTRIPRSEVPRACSKVSRRTFSSRFLASALLGSRPLVALGILVDKRRRNRADTIAPHAQSRDPSRHALGDTMQMLSTMARVPRVSH